MRLPRVMQVFDSQEVSLYLAPSTVRLITSLLMCAWLFHAVTCMYWFIASRANFATTWSPEPEVANNPNSQNYLVTTMWTLSTTFGFQPPTFPVTGREALFTILASMLGIALSSYVIGIITAALSPSEDDENEIRRRKTEHIMVFMRNRNIPLYFQRLVLGFYDDKGYNDRGDSPLLNIPPIIAIRLSLLLNRQLVSTIPSLQTLDLNTILLLMQNLHDRVFLPGDWIYEKGDAPMFLYFIKKGFVEMYLDGNPELVCSTLGKGTMFGQVALFTNEPQECSVQCVIYSEILMLDKFLYDDPNMLSHRFKDIVSTETKREQHRIKTFRSNMNNEKLNRSKHQGKEMDKMRTTMKKKSLFARAKELFER